MVKVIGDFVEVQGKHEEKKVSLQEGALWRNRCDLLC